MTDAETIETVRRALRGETPIDHVYGEERLLIAALAAEVRVLHEEVRKLREAAR